MEASGTPTVVLGSALDIVEHCGVPRFAFVDFPLGNPCGRPYDRQMQRDVVAAAVGMFETATAPNATLRLSQRWGDDGWRDAYMAIDDAELAELARRGAERRAHRQALRVAGRVRQG